MPRALHGARLADFLEHEFPTVRRAHLRQCIAAGAVRRNGMAETANVRLRGDDYVEVELPADGSADAADTRLAAHHVPVLHEGPGHLVIAKPAGLLTVPGRHGGEPSVHGLLPGLRPEADLRIVHRLDRNTSGCLLLACGVDAARHFDAAFRAGAVHKQYTALVHGVLAGRRTIDLPLMPDPRRPGLTAVATRGEREASDAHTELEAMAVHGDFTLLRLWPRTGRTHQLRCHLAAIGHPIVADADYGGRPLLLSELKRGYKLRRGVRERPLLERTFLHANQIRFPDLDGAACAVEAPLPDDLRTALARLAPAEPATS